MANTGCEGIEEWRTVNHIHRGNDAMCEGQINCLNTDDAEKWSSNTYGRRPNSCFGVSTSETRLTQQSVPLKAT